jgi:hypothetical protein
LVLNEKYWGETADCSDFLLVWSGLSESNRHLNLGKVPYYHYTKAAQRNDFSYKIFIARPGGFLQVAAGRSFLAQAFGKIAKIPARRVRL